MAAYGLKESRPVLREDVFKIAVRGHLYGAHHPFAVSIRQRGAINSRPNQTVYSGRCIEKNLCSCNISVKIASSSY